MPDCATSVTSRLDKLARDQARPFCAASTVKSFRQILQQHSRVFVLDAASTIIHAGYAAGGVSPQWQSTETEAIEGVFSLAGNLKINANEIGAFVFCEGPGSILGIRAVAMALRTWTALRPCSVYTYRSLELLAAQNHEPGTAIICDARRNRWHRVITTSDSARVAMDRCATDELSPPIAMPSGFRTWTREPDLPIERLPYQPARLADDLIDVPLLNTCTEPDAFLHEDPSYTRWTPKVHRAPAEPDS